MSIRKAIKLASGLLKEITGSDTIGPITGASGTLTRAAGVASGTQVVTIGFQPTQVRFIAYVTADTNTSSDGMDDGTIAICTSTNNVTLLATILSTATIRPTDSIYIAQTLGGGHRANITAKSSTGFTLTWTEIGAGAAITVKYIAIF